MHFPTINKKKALIFGDIILPSGKSYDALAIQNKSVYETLEMVLFQWNDIKPTNVKQYDIVYVVAGHRDIQQYIGNGSKKDGEVLANLTIHLQQLCLALEGKGFKKVICVAPWVSKEINMIVASALKSLQIPTLHFMPAFGHMSRTGHLNAAGKTSLQFAIVDNSNGIRKYIK